jgi:hypothetical protein
MAFWTGMKTKKLLIFNYFLQSLFFFKKFKKFKKKFFEVFIPVKKPHFMPKKIFKNFRDAFGTW